MPNWLYTILYCASPFAVIWLLSLVARPRERGESFWNVNDN